MGSGHGISKVDGDECLPVSTRFPLDESGGKGWEQTWNIHLDCPKLTKAGMVPNTSKPANRKSNATPKQTRYAHPKIKHPES